MRGINSAAFFALMAFARTLKRIEQHHFWMFLIVLLRLHYQHRFDPPSLAEAERKMLA
jgi:hypothetical protein